MKLGALFLVAVCGTSAAASQDVLGCQYAPGWESSGATRQHDASNLFEYKDGGAEGYLTFDFVRMSSLDCKSGKNTLTIDISEMKSPDAAYGIFAANLDPTLPTSQIGMGGQVQEQSAMFAKGSHFVEIVETAADPNEDNRTTMRSFAAGIETRLEGTVTPPAQVTWFPAGNVAPIRMIPESVLGLSELKRGFVTNYPKGQAFIVLESSPEIAAQVLNSLRRRFAASSTTELGDDALEAQVKYLDGICIFRKGRVLAGYVNLPTAQEAVQQAARLAVRIP